MIGGRYLVILENYRISKAGYAVGYLARYKSSSKLGKQFISTSLHPCLQEVMARATPTKNKNEVKELTSRLHRAEEDNADLRGELDKLHKLQVRISLSLALSLTQCFNMQGD